MDNPAVDTQAEIVLEDDLDDIEEELTHSGREVTLGLLPSTNLDQIRSLMSGRPWTRAGPRHRC